MGNLGFQQSPLDWTTYLQLSVRGDGTAKFRLIPTHIICEKQTDSILLGHANIFCHSNHFPTSCVLNVL